MRELVMAGQYLDMFVQARGEFSADDALRVAEFKTSKYTVEGPLHLGAAMADAPPEVFAALSAYAVPLGESFQLRDDVLGVFGDPLETGKPAGDDLREGKHTLLVALSVDLANEQDAAMVRAELGNRDDVGPGGARAAAGHRRQRRARPGREADRRAHRRGPRRARGDPRPPRRARRWTPWRWRRPDAPASFPTESIEKTHQEAPVPDPSGWSFETRQIHAGQSPDAVTHARALPIYQTTSYTFDSTEHASNLFALKEFGNIYTRIMNPTQDAVEQRIASLEGGVGALLTASGQSAETLALLNLAETGDHIVSSARLYGGTYNLFHYTFPKLGIEVSFVDDPDDLEQWRAAVRPNTKAFFGETVSNPQLDVLDIEAVAALAHEVGVPLVLDNTIPTPYLLRPFEWGADIVVHSATKYLGGHGSAIGGVIVDSGNFDYGADPERFPNYNQPDPSYHGLVYARDLGVGSPLGANLAFILKARVQLLRDFGPAIAPFNAFLIAQGLETLSLRIERHVQNAQAVAEWLEARSEVLGVNYAGLPSSTWHARAQKYAPKGTGGVLAFEIDGGIEAGKRFVEALELHSHVANIGDVRSLVIHPASTTHSQLSPEEQLAAGVTPGLVRLSVGIENITDILADLEAGFRAAKSD